ncbi:MAG: 1-acyl-sn-glycerol-3-phosphate acyltransferase [Bacteroidia bacterium]|jgi:1-acyl-sn-glycerol-3-phosphate acyltransferase
MLYHFVKFWLQLYSRVYFKRVFISGESNIPKDQPVFLACNHSNGFLDGTMVSGLLYQKSTRVFVRGDVFNRGWANYILRSIKLIPIFRARDGESRRNKEGNNRSFDQLYLEFEKNRWVLIFPEADAQIEKRLRPLKNGMARMIIDMQAREEGKMEVAVVPFGLNYTHYKYHRNEIMISFSEPVYLKDYLTEGGNERTAFTNLTKDTGRKIEEQMVVVDEGDDDITETALRIVRADRNEPFLKFRFNSKDRLEAEIATANAVKQSELGGGLRNAIQAYQLALDQVGTSESGSKPIKIWQYIFFLLFIIPSSLSWLVTQWGLFFGKKLVDAIVKKDELYESIYFGIGLAYNLLLIVIGMPIFAILYGWYGVVGWFIFQWLSIPYQHCRDIFLQFQAHQKWNKQGDKLNTLRATVLKELNW